MKPALLSHGWCPLLCLCTLIGLGTNVHAQPSAIKAATQLTKFKADSVRITAFGAKGDGQSLNTTAINTAIERQSVKGGGVVVIPSGLWLTGPITLKSNVNLHLEANAYVQFTTDFSQYKLIPSVWEGEPQMRNQSPINANGQQNIAVTGKGILDGGGDAWRMVKKSKLTQTEWQKLVASGGQLSSDKSTWYPSAQSAYGASLNKPGQIKPERTAAYYDSVKDFLRPNMVLLENCNRILLQGITFQNSPAWNIHLLTSNNIRVSEVTARNPWYAQNGDGIDIESCKNIIVEKSTFDVGDDGICIKSGRDEFGRKRGLPTENLWVSQCRVYAAHGGFVIGSEMSGGARNIWVEDCTFIGTDIGLRFKTARGRGGIVENIHVNRINMHNIKGEAILFDMYYEAKDPIVLAGEVRQLPKVETKPVTEATPQFRNFQISDVFCNGAEKAVFMRGLPEMPVRNISLSNMQLTAKEGIDVQEAEGIRFNNIQLKTSAAKEPTVAVLQSKQIQFENVQWNKVGGENPVRISGDKSAGVVFTRSAIQQPTQATVELGASEKSLMIHP